MTSASCIQYVRASLLISPLLGSLLKQKRVKLEPFYGSYLKPIPTLNIQERIVILFSLVPADGGSPFVPLPGFHDRIHLVIVCLSLLLVMPLPDVRDLIMDELLLFADFFYVLIFILQCVLPRIFSFQGF